MNKAYYDEKTQQEFFSPIISEPRGAYRSGGVETFQSLYNDHFYKQQKIEKIEQERQLAAIEAANKKHTTTESEEIMFKIRRKTFFAMFRLYADEESKTIGGEAIDDTECPLKFRIVLEPVLEGLRETGERLNEKEFVIACEKLYNVFL